MPLEINICTTTTIFILMLFRRRKQRKRSRSWQRKLFKITSPVQYRIKQRKTHGESSRLEQFYQKIRSDFFIIERNHKIKNQPKIILLDVSFQKNVMVSERHSRYLQRRTGASLPKIFYFPTMFCRSKSRSHLPQRKEIRSSGFKEQTLISLFQ